MKNYRTHLFGVTFGFSPFFPWFMQIAPEIMARAGGQRKGQRDIAVSPLT